MPTKYFAVIFISLVSSTWIIVNGATAREKTGDIGAEGASFQRNTKGRLCENEEEFYHNATKKCFLPTRSLAAFHAYRPVPNPCGALQYFYKVNEEYGSCDCIWDDDEFHKGCIAPFHRPILNWPGSNRCYYAYAQGPCKSGEWIVINRKTLMSECRPNPCHNLKLKETLQGLGSEPKDPVEVFWFLKGNQCHQTFTQAYCEPGTYARFLGTSVTPVCFPVERSPFCGYGSGTVATLDCKQGTKMVGSECVPSADFD